jgi:F-type H+-transporting ATPase subunit b
MILRFLFVSALLLAPATAFASGGFAPTEFIGFVVNFVILAGVVVFLTKKKINSFFEQRSAAIAKDMEDAKRVHDEATELLAEYNARLASLKQETEEILARFRQDGEREKARIKNEAQEEATRIRREAEFRISQESKMARQRLLDDFAPAVLALAEEQIKARLNNATRENYFAEGLGQLKSIRPEQVLSSPVGEQSAAPGQH